MSLTVRNVFDNLLLLAGYTSPTQANDVVQREILQCISAAAQLIQACGEKYYGREPLSVSLTAGTYTYALDKTVQTVIDQAVLLSTQAPLIRLNDRAQVDNFGPLYLGQTSRALANGTPMAYFAESLHDTNGTTNAPNSVSITLWVLPAPASNDTLQLQVIRTAAQYQISDLFADVTIPVPNAYAETIFMPVARHYVTTNPRFYKEERLPAIDADYRRALVLLGLNDPQAFHRDAGVLRGVPYGQQIQPQQPQAA